jgi:hypothetical protein
MREGDYCADLGIEWMVSLRETVEKCDGRALTVCIFLKWLGFLNEAATTLSIPSYDIGKWAWLRTYQHPLIIDYCKLTNVLVPL